MVRTKGGHHSNLTPPWQSMADGSPADSITIMGAGLSGLAAATLLARAGREVHVHDIRNDSGARFDGDFQA